MIPTVQYDERDVNQTYTGVATSIPASAPYKARLNEVPDEIEGVIITRISAATPDGGNGGSGTMTTGGHYTGVVDRNYKVEIDLAGELGAATFKWSNDNGATWEDTGVTTAADVTLEDGIHVYFAGNGGQDFDLGDIWTFTAESWTAQSYAPTGTEEVMVNYVTGDLTFHSTDASKTVKVSYEGRGSLVDADDYNSLADAVGGGYLVLSKQDTSSFAVGDLVYISGNDTFGKADAEDDTKPAVGMVSVVSATDGEITIIGIVSGLAGLVANTRYYLAAPLDLILFDDCGDTEDVEEWIETVASDALNPEKDTTHVKESDYSMKLGVDADKHAADNAIWTLTGRAAKDLSSYSSDWIYLWVYVSDLDPLHLVNTVFRFAIGSDVTHYIYFDWVKTDLAAGWNLLKCDLDNPDGNVGVPDWANTDYAVITITCKAANAVDFYFCIDEINVVRPRPGEYVATTPPARAGNIAQFIGRGLSTTKMLTRISEDYITI